MSYNAQEEPLPAAGRDQLRNIKISRKNLSDDI
jgi:hypothetical protein